ncbi:hypothetical protein MASR1M49_20390 [Pararhodobacter aggregans]
MCGHPSAPSRKGFRTRGAARKGGKLNRDAFLVQKTLEAPRGKPKFNHMDPPCGGPGPRPPTVADPHKAAPAA